MPQELFKNVESFVIRFLERNKLSETEQLLFQSVFKQEPIFFIEQSDSVSFLAAILRLLHKRRSAALFSCLWSRKENQDVKAKLRNVDNLTGTDQDLQLKMEQNFIFLVPTGGSSGKIKFAIHDQQTLSASVAGFQSFFGLEQIHCFCILPLYHVSGLMQVWRSLLTDGTFYLGNYGELKQKILPEEDFSEFCISLVPTQLQVLLNVCPEWLQQFKLILLGGAPPWRSLLDQARQYELKIALSYGMTETASMVVALKPEEFLAGKDCAGQVMPHAKIHLDQDGLISIEGQSLCHGYYPEWRGDRFFMTDDIGYFDADGLLHIVGRQSQKIISGGENIYPSDIEAAIQATNLVTDVTVCGVADEYWGQIVTAVIVLKIDVKIEEVKEAIAQSLPKYKQPKQWLSVAKLPHNAQGKVNQTVLRAMIEKDYQSRET